MLRGPLLSSTVKQDWSHLRRGAGRRVDGSVELLQGRHERAISSRPALHSASAACMPVQRCGGGPALKSSWRLVRSTMCGVYGSPFSSRASHTRWANGHAAGGGKGEESSEALTPPPPPPGLGVAARWRQAGGMPAKAPASARPNASAASPGPICLRLSESQMSMGLLGAATMAGLGLRRREGCYPNYLYCCKREKSERRKAIGHHRGLGRSRQYC